MLDSPLHKTILISVLKAVADDPDLRTRLGFKGGTAAFLFYSLPRFSVDLDFDLLEEGTTELVFAKMTKICQAIGQLREATNKHHTLFFLVNYQKGLHHLKVEISKRTTGAEYEVKQFLGISLLVMKPEDMLAGKLAALLNRRQLASRDMFDLWFFLSQHWHLREPTLLAHTGLTLPEALGKAMAIVEQTPPAQFPRGLGELLTAKQKAWVKEKLKSELLFQLKLYGETHK